MFVAVNSAIAAFGAANAVAGAGVVTASGVNASANVAALNPALGLIGQDFVVAFTGAQASFLESVAEVGVVYGEIAAGTAANIGAHTTTEVANVAAVTAAGLIAG